MKKFRNLSPGWLTNVSLLTFLFLALLVPWKDLYRLFFFAGVMPGVLWNLKSVGIPGPLKTRASLLMMGLVAYLGCSSFLVSDVAFIENLDQLRWAIELLFLITAVLVSGNYWVRSPRLYGLLFLGAVVIAGLSALIPYLWAGNFSARLAGFGFLAHPIQGPSTLLVLWTIGIALLGLANAGRWVDRLLVLVSFSTVIAFALLSQSRGPVVAAIATLLLAIAARGISVPKIRVWALLAVAISLASVIGIAWWAAETPDSWLYQTMTQRGLSYRPEIWAAVLANCQNFWLLGVGASTDFIDTVPGTILKQDMGYVFHHSHNLFLQTFLVGGVLALALLLAAVGIMTVRLFRLYEMSRSPAALTGLGVLLVTIMVNFTDTAQLLSSPTPDWVLLWLPLSFVALLVAHERNRTDRSSEVSCREPAR